MKLVDIDTAKKAKAAQKRKQRKSAKRPDENLVFKDFDGVEWFTYSIRYAYQGKNYTIDIKASSEKDAWGRLYAIRSFPVEINLVCSVLS